MGANRKRKGEISSEIIYLNNDKFGNYKSIDDMISDIPNKLPKLCEKFSFEAEDFSEDDMPIDYSEEENPSLDSFKKFSIELEKELNTSLSITEQWKSEIIIKTPPTIVGFGFHLESVSDENTFLISNLYTRKKKLPAAIVGYNITTDVSTVFFESPEKMIYNFAGRTKDSIFIVGGYGGGVTANEVDGFFYHILIFDTDMKLKEECKLPCVEGEFLDSCCYLDNKLYLAIRKMSYGRMPHSIENNMYILEVDLESKKIVGKLDDASSPQAAADILYYLKENLNYAGYGKKDLYCYTLGDSKLYLERVTNFVTTDNRLFVVQENDENYAVKTIDIKTRTELEILSKGNCEIANISATNTVVAFDIFAINGSKTFDKLTIFYHIQKQEYRIMEATFLSRSIVDTGFCKVIGDYYYAEMTDYQDISSSRAKQIICRGKLNTLFSAK